MTDKISLFDSSQRKQFEDLVFKYKQADYLRKMYGSPEEVLKNKDEAFKALELQDISLKTEISHLSDFELVQNVYSARTDLN